VLKVKTYKTEKSFIICLFLKNILLKQVFKIGIADAVSRGKAYVALTPTLSVSQSSHDIRLLNADTQRYEKRIPGFAHS
jgi:hypothetical protein